MKINRLIASAILGILLVSVLGSTPASAGTAGLSVAATHSQSAGLLSVLQRVLAYLGLSSSSSRGKNFIGGTSGI